MIHALRPQPFIDYPLPSYTCTSPYFNYFLLIAAARKHSKCYSFSLLLSGNPGSMRVEARDSYAETGIADSLKISKPIHSQQEMCFFYTMCADENGRTFAGIYNHRLALGVLIHFDGRLLDHFTQWKMMGEGEYALGLEPGNASVLGVQEETRLGHVKFLEPWESRSYRFTIQVMEGENDLRKAKAAVTRLQSNSAR